MDDKDILKLNMEFVFLRETAYDGDERVAVVVNGHRVAQSEWCSDPDIVSNTIRMYADSIKETGQALYDWEHPQHRTIQ